MSKPNKRRQAVRRGAPDVGAVKAPDRGAARQPGEPPVTLSVARGMRAAGSSAPTLAASFLAVLALWLTLSAYGVNLAAAPAAMAALAALPPVHSFLDLQFLASGDVVSPVKPVVVGALLLLIRAALFGSAVGFVLDSFADQAEPVSSWPGRGRRVLRTLPSMLAVEAGFFGLAVAGLLLAPALLGASLGQLGVIVVLFGGTYLFLHAPVIAAVEGRGARAAFTLAVRAARLPGRQFMLLAFGYILLVTFFSVTTPTSAVAAATPSFVLWAYVLLVTFVHVSALAALTYRWVHVREAILGAAPEGRTPRGQTTKPA